jgi:hypothetical protein
MGIDSEERLIIYNGAVNNPSESSLLLDGEVINFEVEDSKIELGDSNKVYWRGEEYVFYKTEFPILKIETSGDGNIGDLYSSSKFNIIENGQSTSTGNLGIRVRGGSSQLFPKKSYRLELWEDSEGIINRDVSLLGMRSDDDWLLDGMWNEPMMIRDKSAMELWLNFGRVHYQTEEPNLQLGADRIYCELFIDNSYLGLYYLGERLDRKQLKLDKLSNSSEGGELYKAIGWGGAVGNIDFPPVDNNSVSWANYWLKYPDISEDFDWNDFRDFTFCSSSCTLNEFEENYSDLVDKNNAYDFLIFINLLGAFDNFGNNTFVARKNAESPYFFVSWDFDATLGIGITGYDAPFLIDDNFRTHHILTKLLVSDDNKEEFKLRWSFLRSDILNGDNIKSIYRGNYDKLIRNKIFLRENSISKLERDYPDPSSIIYLEDAIDQRLDILDQDISSL